jgi:hypothetical protein
VARQQFGLVLGNLRELTFQRFGNASMKRAPRLPQQGAVGGVLHQRMLEQVAGMRWYALPEQQASGNQTVQADTNSASGLLTTADRRACENSRPIVAPTCAISFADPSRSSRAISDACRLAGTASVGVGTEATVRCAAPSLPASSTALVISSTNRGMPSVRLTMSCRMFAGTSLLPTTPSIMASMSSLRQPIDRENRHVRPSDPGRVELWTERDNQQHTQGPKAVNDPADSFEARGIHPMRVLDDHQHRILPGQRLHLANKRFEGFLPTLLGGQIECGIAAIVRQR